MKKYFILSAILLVFIVSCKKSANNESQKSTNFLDNTTSTLPITDNGIISLSENGSEIQNADIPDVDNYYGDLELSSNTSNQKNKKNEPYTQELFQAISNKDINKINSLVLKGVNLNQLNPVGDTPLSEAILLADNNIVKFLIEKGANVNFPTSNGYTALSLAIVNRDKSIIDTILDNKNIDLYAVFNNFWSASPIYVAIYEGCDSCIHKLMKHGFNINHDFSKYNAENLIFHGLNSKQFMNQEDYNKTINALLDYNVNIKVLDKKGNSPLIKAIENRDFKIALRLLSMGADYSYSNNNKTAKSLINSISSEDVDKFDNETLKSYNRVRGILNNQIKQEILNEKQKNKITELNVGKDNNSENKEIVLDNKTSVK